MIAGQYHTLYVRGSSPSSIDSRGRIQLPGVEVPFRVSETHDVVSRDSRRHAIDRIMAGGQPEAESKSSEPRDAQQWMKKVLTQQTHRPARLFFEK